MDFEKRHENQDVVVENRPAARKQDRQSSSHATSETIPQEFVQYVRPGINSPQSFVIPLESVYSCLGFDTVAEAREHVRAQLKPGEHYVRYRTNFISVLRQHYEQTKFR